MNVRQGMFRLWVVLSAVFVLGVVVASYSSIIQEFRFASQDWDAVFKEYGGSGSLIPVDCGQALGVLSTDYSQSDGECWYVKDAFRNLYPEYKDLNDHDLNERLYAKAGRPLKHFHPWVKVGEAVGVAFGVPLAVLVLGFSLMWVGSGFSRTKPELG